MTTHVTFFSRHELVRVRIAPGTNHVVHSGPVGIKAVGNGIVRNGGQGSQVGHIGPEAIPRGEVCRVDLSSLGRVKVFTGIVQGPTIHIGHLGTLVTDNPPHLTRLDDPRSSILRGDFHLLDEFSLALGDGVGQRYVQGIAAVFGRNLFNGVTRNRFGIACQGTTIDGTG
eukprot:scaffold2519_cov168-Amphora_coffeaeformis.AAC.5